MNNKDLHNCYFFSGSSFFFLFVLLIFFSPSLGAVPLESGMEIPDVISRWGGPQEKIQYETLRAERWLYTEGREVYFKKGKVVSWKGKESQVTRPHATKSVSSDVVDSQINVPTRDAKRRRGKESILSVNSFLSEVEKESSEDSPEDSKKPSRKNKRRS